MIKSNQVDQKVLKVTTKEKLRSLSDHTGVFSDKFYLRDLKEEFYYDPADTTSADNGVDIFVNVATGRRYKLWQSPATTSEIDNILNVEIPVAVSDRLPYKTLTQVRSASSIDYTDIRITDRYKEGVFRYDPADTTSVDDGALVIVNSSTGKRYKRVDFDTVDVRWFGAIADGVTDFRTQLQASLNNTICKRILIPNVGAPYRISNSIFIASNTDLYLEPGVEIYGLGTNTNHLIRLDNAENVIIHGQGATVRDMKASYPTTSEFFGGIALRSCKNITINGLNIRDVAGDGIYMGVLGSDRVTNTNVRIENVNIDNANRNGISATNNDGLWITNCHIKNTIGNPPQAGIDLEPNTPVEFLRSIFITNLKTENCEEAGLTIALGALTGSVNDVSIKVTNHIDIGSRYGLYTPGYSGLVKGNVTVNNPTWINNSWCAYLNNGTNPDGVRFDINNPIIKNPFRNNTTGVYGYYAAMLLYRHSSNPTTLTSLGNVHIKNAYIEDDVTPPPGEARVPLSGIILRDFNGIPWTNVTIDSPVKINVPSNTIRLDHTLNIKVIDDFNVFNKMFTGSGETFLIRNQGGPVNNYVKKISNRLATGNNSVEFSIDNPDEYEFDIFIDSPNRITLTLPTSYSAPDLYQINSNGIYSESPGSYIKLKVLKEEKRVIVLDIRGQWYARSNDMPINNLDRYYYEEITGAKGVGITNRNGVLIVKEVPSLTTTINIPPAGSMKGRYLIVKRDAANNGNAVNLYVNTSANTGLFGTINNGTRQFRCLTEVGECIKFWCDGLDYKIVSWFRPSKTTYTASTTAQNKTSLNSAHGIRQAGFEVHFTSQGKSYKKIADDISSDWLEQDWATGEITRLTT